MNKWLLICFLGLVSVALANSSLKNDKETLIKALKEKFRQFKLKSASNKPQIITKESSENSEKATLPKHQQDQHQHDKASSALGLALLDLPKIKPKHTKPEHTTNHEKTKAVLVEKTDNGDDEDDDDEDDDDDNAMVTKINKHLEATDKKTKDSKDKHLNMDSKKSHKKKEKNDDDDDDDDDSKHDDDDSKHDDDDSKHDDEDTETNDNDESSSKDSSDVSDDDEDEGKIKNSDKKLKNSVKSLKNSVKNLKDKDLKSVNVGDLKKLLSTSVENLDKAEKAIHNLLQYDQDKKNANKNQKTTAGPQQGYQPQSQYGGYPQVPSSAYQQTCPGQCSSLCAPGCRDPCCRFPPNMQGYNSAPVTAKGSYQQGLINSYPPLTSLGAAQSGDNYQQGLSQQCGSQCSPQSCAPSCNPSCCSSGVQGLSTMPQGPVVPQGQVNAGCPSSCFSTCNAGCPRRCCVPGRK